MNFKRLSLPASAICATLMFAACTTPLEQPKAPVEQQTPQRPPTEPVQTLMPVAFSALPGWNDDNLREAWPAFIASCKVMIKKAAWQDACATAQNVQADDVQALRAYFESFFIPYQVLNPDGSDVGLVTGYYEPLLHGARSRSGPYQTPLYAAPSDLLTIDLASLYPELKNKRLRGRVVGNKVVPYFTRKELEQSGVLRGNELMWVDDPIEAFFLQVQGSGRVELMDKRETVRVAYADQNGHPYRSIGRYLVDQGEMTLDQASAQSIKAWYVAHPARQQELLDANPSYVFFKEEKIIDPSVGPKGAQGVPLTPERSIAVDPQFIPLGAPVFISTTYPSSTTPLQKLVMAQDTGGAIRNAVRADYFWGFGSQAGAMAGKMKQRGMLWVLLPKPLIIAPGNP